MPRKARIDAPGTLHHIIVRGLARQRIFYDDADRDDFLDRLGRLLDETWTACYAWSLMPNHFHLLLKSGAVRLSRIMQRLLTGYAIHFNRRHHRQGHLFQNRFKSILCQEEPYFLELVRYIHLNPIRAGIVRDLDELRRYPYSGHSAFFSEGLYPWQDTRFVLGCFKGPPVSFREQYLAFVQQGIEMGRRSDLTGGGLIRSAGGWTAVKTLRQSNVSQKSDERILGDGRFVEKMLAHAHEELDQRHRLVAGGMDYRAVLQHVVKLSGVDPDHILSNHRNRSVVRARSLLFFWATEILGMAQVELSRKFGISQAAVSMAVRRGRNVAEQNRYTLCQATKRDGITTPKYSPILRKE